MYWVQIGNRFILRYWWAPLLLGEKTTPSFLIVFTTNCPVTLSADEVEHVSLLTLSPARIDLFSYVLDFSFIATNH